MRVGVGDTTTYRPPVVEGIEVSEVKADPACVGDVGQELTTLRGSPRHQQEPQVTQIPYLYVMGGFHCVPGRNGPKK